MDNFWHNKRVTLCGGASLIGVHLGEALIEKGVGNLRIVDDFSAGKFSNLHKIVQSYGVEIRKADLRDYASVVLAVRDADVVFHLAAQHGGRGYVATHKKELFDNLDLDTTIFRACAERSKVEKVIFSSSACAYPIDLQTNSEEYVYLSEGMIDYGNAKQADGAYGMEKLLGEMILDAYIEEGCFAGCSTRSFTVYGKYMTESHAIAALIAKTMLKPDVFEVWGDGEQIRNWTHVEDNVQGAILAAENLERGAINIGVEERLTPKMACELIWEIMGWRPEKVWYREDKPVGPRNRVADATKLKSLGWTPKYSFEEGLRKTIDWYLETHNADEIREKLERLLTER